MPPTPNQAIERFLRLARDNGVLLPQRQRAAAERRQQADESFRPTWTSMTHWHTPEGAYAIGSMTDAHLWHTINWAVRNAVPLFIACGTKPPDNVSQAFASANWLRDQVTFRALVKEAVRRDFTFPPDVFRYLRDFCVLRNELAVFEPWHNPDEQEQVEQLKPFELQPLLPPTEEFGKDLRSIEL